MTGPVPTAVPTVLVVDDEADLVWVVRFNLEMEGYRTFVAGNGEDALDMLPEVRPDLILLDLMMPVMDGWAVLDQIRRTGGTSALIVVVSARTGPYDKQRAGEYGVDGFVGKPFDMEELLRVIRALLPPPMPRSEGPHLTR
jgi:two-component system phosphate regulon response regulator PhoB